MSTCLRKVLAPWCPRLTRAPLEHSFPVRAFISVESRSPATLEALRLLQSVKNIRDLSEACGNIAPGKVFRSACPVGADTEDAHIIQHNLKIQHMIDLRSDYERQRDVPLSNGILNQAVYRRHVIKGQGVDIKTESALGRQVEGHAAMQIDLLSFLERDRYYKAMLTRLPYQTAASIVFWGLFNQSYAKSLAIKEVNKAGLQGLYEIILETAGPEIRHALQIIVESAEANKPILFFCKIGKDRTGLLCSLILSCCGATPDEIVSDYIRSDGVDDVGLGGMEKDKELSELDADLFTRAPPGVMQATLQHLDMRYGGASGYLDSIGFSKEKQNRLATILAPPNALCFSLSPSRLLDCNNGLRRKVAGSRYVCGVTQSGLGQASVVVVEGSSDARAVRRAGVPDVHALGSSTLVSGVAAEKAFLALKDLLKHSERIVTLLDPDEAGRRCRDRLEDRLKGSLLHAFIPAPRATAASSTRWHEAGNIGVEHASTQAIRIALSAARQAEPMRRIFTQQYLIELSLAASFNDPAGRNVTKRRHLVGSMLGFGKCDGGQMLKQLNLYGFTKSELLAAIRDVEPLVAAV